MAVYMCILSLQNSLCNCNSIHTAVQSPKLVSFKRLDCSALKEIRSLMTCGVMQKKCLLKSFKWKPTPQISITTTNQNLTPPNKVSFPCPIRETIKISFIFKSITIYRTLLRSTFNCLKLRILPPLNISNITKCIFVFIFCFQIKFHFLLHLWKIRTCHF